MEQRWRIQGGVVGEVPLRMILYFRERGPICYEAPLFADDEQLTVLPGLLLMSGLDWCWESERWRDVAENFADLGLPAKRHMTELTPHTAKFLSDDLRERNLDNYGRATGLFGTDADAVSTLLNPVTFRAALEGFSAREEGPIRIVVLQIGDHPSEDIFVPHDPDENVGPLLEIWNIRPSAVRQTRPYRESQLLEAIYGLPGGREGMHRKLLKFFRWRRQRPE